MTRDQLISQTVKRIIRDAFHLTSDDIEERRENIVEAYLKQLWNEAISRSQIW